MPGFSTAAAAKTTQRKKMDDGNPVASYSYNIEEKISELNLVKLSETGVKAAGWDIALLGPSKSGKSVSAISLGYLNLEFKDLLLNAGYNEIVEALEAGVIPEVKKIVVIDSENALLSQLNYAYERMMFSPLRDRIQILPIEISNLRKIASPDGKVQYDEESINRMTESLRTFTAAIEWASKLDENTLVIIDSMSIYKLLLDAVTGFMTELKLKDISDTKERNDYRTQRWQERNSWWLDSLRKMRNFKGWSVGTFMMKENAKWVESAFKVPRFVPIWTETTEYNYDMCIQFEIEAGTNVRIARIRSGRYVDTDNPADNEVHIYGKIEDEVDRVQFLSLLNKTLKIAKGGYESWEKALL